MKKKLLLFSVTVILNSVVFSQTTDQFNQIPVSCDSLKKHVFTLASAEMQGRNTGSAGQKNAAEYIVRSFIFSGISPGNDTSYYQKFYLQTPKFKRFCIETGDSKFQGLFFGIKEQSGIDENSQFIYVSEKTELSGLNVQSDDVVVFEPESKTDAVRLIEVLKRKGVSQVFLIKSKKNFRKTIEIFERFNGNYRLPTKKEESLLSDLQAVSTTCDIYILNEADFRLLFSHSSSQIEDLDKSKQHVLINAPKNIVTKITEEKRKISNTENVLGLIRGAKFPEKLIVVTAHYDHIGVDGKGINYGADDNASGTSALLEIARTIKQAQNNGFSPDCSIMFAAFCAEELGLYGSEFFTESDIFQKYDVILNINMDMIGKSIKYNVIKALISREKPSFVENPKRKKKYVYMLASDNTADFQKEIKSESKQIRKFKVDKTPGMMNKLIWQRASDHWNFKRKDVPIVVFFTGLHPDYHTTRDTPEKIDYENLTRIAQTISSAILNYAGSLQQK